MSDKRTTMFHDKPTVWWLNTNILDGHYDEGLPRAYATDEGSSDMEVSAGCASLAELRETDEYKESSKTKSRAAYNIENGCATIGYSYYGKPGEHAEFMKHAIDLRDGRLTDISSVSEKGTVLRGALNKVRVLCREVKSGDIIWMRDKTCGIYYVGQVSRKSQWRNVRNLETFVFDCTNQLSDIAWSLVGAEDAIPGVISIQSRGTSIQRISKEGAIEFSVLLLNELIGEGKPYVPYDLEAIWGENMISDDAATLFRMLGPDSAEDLLCAWLYKEHGYIPIPSTNKRGTAAYEFTMVSPKTGKKCFPQVKNDKREGDAKLDARGYGDLVPQGDVWLLVTREPEESIENFDNPREGVHVMSSEDVEMLYRFAKDNRMWMSDEIRKWVTWLAKYGVAKE